MSLDPRPLAEMFKPRTKYLCGRLRQTRWADHRVISDLIAIEDHYAGVRRGGLHLLWVQNHLVRHYVLESIIIKHELRTGVTLTEIQARQLLDLELERQARFDHARQAEERARAVECEHHKFANWLKAGGMP